MTTRKPTENAPAVAGANAEPALGSGVVMVDPPPNPPSYLGTDWSRLTEEEAQAEYKQKLADFDARLNGRYLLESIAYSWEQWKAAGADLPKLINEILASPDSESTRLIHAMTKKPENRERKPRQGKSRWQDGRQAELVLAVQRELLAPNRITAQRTITHACRKLAGRSGPQQWRGNKDLPRRYREAVASPFGGFVLRLCDTVLPTRVPDNDQESIRGFLDTVGEMVAVIREREK